MKTTSAVSIGVSLSLAGLLSSVAHGRQRGIVADGCTGCHGNRGATVTMTADRDAFEPGDEVTFTVSVQNAGIQNAGVYLRNGDVGSLRLLAGQNLAVVDGGLTHSTPKSVEAGQVTFDLAWIAPDQPGNVVFQVFALAGNGNGSSSGDTAADGQFSWVYGCEGQEFFVDYDHDGFGSDVSPSLVDCAGPPPEGYSEVSTDCAEFVSDSYPGAPELCNERDDNCNGEIDEDSTPVEMWPDPDEDGFYGPEDGESIVGCKEPGYASVPGDCEPNNPDIHPEAEEVCNAWDDNCDGRVDERTRPQCGVGFCRRESLSCLESDCTPGRPVEETCNALDDDCDGETDEGEVCEPGHTCVNGDCLGPGMTGLPQSPNDDEGRQPTAPTTGNPTGQGGASAPEDSASMGGATGAMDPGAVDPGAVDPGAVDHAAAGSSATALSTGRGSADPKAMPEASTDVDTASCSHTPDAFVRNAGGPRWGTLWLLMSVLLVVRGRWTSNRVSERVLAVATD